MIILYNSLTVYIVPINTKKKYIHGTAAKNIQPKKIPVMECIGYFLSNYFEIYFGQGKGRAQNSYNAYPGWQAGNDGYCSFACKKEKNY